MFALALLVTMLLLASVMRAVDQRDRASFEAAVTRTTDAVEERIDTVVTLLRGTAGLLAARPDASRAQFAAYVGELRLRERYPGILGIGFSERLQPQEVPAREAELRAGGAPYFRIWPQHPRDEVHAIVFIEPLDQRNQAAVGFDMYTEATRREAMQRARDSGAPAASGKVLLLQEIEERKQAGFLIYVPVYRGGTDPETVEERRARLMGFAYAPLRVDDLLQGVRGTGVLQVDYELFDGNAAAPESLLRTTRREGGAPAMTLQRQLHVAGRPWLVRFYSRPAFEALSQRWLLPSLVAMSVVGSLLLAWITYVQARARRDAEAAAAQRRVNELALQASEERARERAERLQQLYAELREGERRKDEFLAVLAHELRNPLAPIRSSLEILRRVPEGPAAQRAREIAERQVRQMVRLIDDLLDVSRISRGKITLQRVPTPLVQVLDAAIETSRPLIEARRHRLQVERPDPALVLDVDPARIAQIFTNLLNNAANYTPEGGEITVGVRQAPGEVRVSVRDNGIGIAPDQLASMFELFVQAQRSPAGGGLGIGLSLASRLAQMHGGRIDATSEGEGRGAEFVVVLPLDATSAPAGGAAVQPQGAAADLQAR